MHRSQQGHFVRAALHVLLNVLTVVFWVAAPIFVVLIAVSSFTESIGALQSLITGISLLVVVLSSGAIAWVEFRTARARRLRHPEQDSRGDAG